MGELSMARVEISEWGVIVEGDDLPSVLQVTIERGESGPITRVMIDQCERFEPQFENDPNVEPAIVPEIHEENEMGPVS